MFFKKSATAGFKEQEAAVRALIARRDSVAQIIVETEQRLAQVQKDIGDARREFASVIGGGEAAERAAQEKVVQQLEFSTAVSGRLDAAKAELSKVKQEIKASIDSLRESLKVDAAEVLRPAMAEYSKAFAVFVVAYRKALAIADGLGDVETVDWLNDAYIVDPATMRFLSADSYGADPEFEALFLKHSANRKWVDQVALDCGLHVSYAPGSHVLGEPAYTNGKERLTSA